MPIFESEILETIRMVEMETLDIRAVTLGVSLRGCAHPDVGRAAENVRKRIVERGGRLVEVVDAIEADYGIPVADRRVSVTPIAIVAESSETEDYTPFAQAMDAAAVELGVDFIGGFSALVEQGMSTGDRRLFASLPAAISATERVCSSLNVATTRVGINMTAVAWVGEIMKDLAAKTADRGGVGCAKLVVFCNAPSGNPFMAGSFHGIAEGDCIVNCGVSGPGVVRRAVELLGADASLDAVAECVKRIAFKITRMGELIGREAASRLGVEFGVVDLSLAPTPTPGDSVAAILELMGVGRAGGHGTTAALAMLTDAVKKGGAMASSHVGGLSGAFIPVSEDAGMIAAARDGTISIDKLEAMTSVCSVGMDMIAVPGDTPAATLAAIVADECAIGMMNNKTTACRLIPVPGMVAGDLVEFGGLLGSAPVMPVHPSDPGVFVQRGGRMPAPIHSLRN